MIELRVMIPHNFPSAVPQFDLVFHPDSYDIQNRALLANQILVLRKNASGEDLIRLNYQSLKTVWATPARRTLNDAFREVFREVNNPPLLFEKNRDLSGVGSFKSINIPNKLNRTVSGKLS